MWLTLIVLPDGTEIFSGPGSGPKVQNATIKQMVNDGEELNIGSCCAARFECTLLNPGGELSIAAGDELTAYRVNGETRQLIGYFTMEEPTRPSANRYKIVSYDRISWLDRDLTDWLLSLEDWPYTVNQFAQMVCAECGLTLATQTFMNGDYQIQRFAAHGITARQLMQWIAQISGTFCRATPEGKIEFTWYRITNTSIGPSGVFSTKLADYQTKTIDRVQIQITQDDIGVIYPDVAGVTYPVTGNYLLTADDSTELEAVAESLYEALRSATYTPGTVVMSHNPDIRPGDIITVRDRNGKTAMMYVMTKTIKGQRDTLECTGSYSRESSTVVHEESFGVVNAKLLELRKNIDGLLVRATAAETRIDDNRAYTDKKITEVTISADGIAATVEGVQETVSGVESRISSFEQTAGEIALRVESIEENGVDKVTTGFGLSINESAVVIARDGAELENRLDETGMYVVRNDGTVVMQAASDGVITQNLNVRGYLDVFGMLRKQAWTDEFGRACVATLWTGG